MEIYVTLPVYKRPEGAWDTPLNDKCLAGYQMYHTENPQDSREHITRLLRSEALTGLVAVLEVRLTSMTKLEDVKACLYLRDPVIPEAYLMKPIDPGLRSDWRVDLQEEMPDVVLDLRPTQRVLGAVMATMRRRFYATP